MPIPNHQNLVHGITCVDTDYYRPALAACYLVTQGDQAGFVDTGTYYSVPKLLEVLKFKGIPFDNVSYVMPTHVHLDHAGGAGELMRHLPNAKLIAHPRAARHLIAPEKLTAGVIAVYGEKDYQESFGALVPVAEERVIIAEDEFTLDFNGRKLVFIDTPGHARHHYSIYDPLSNGFFTGDTFGLSYRELDTNGAAYVLPTTTPTQFDPQAWHATIDRYLSYKPQRMFLTHYGMVSDVPELASDLHRKIDGFVEIARSASDANDRHETILNTLTDYVTRDLAKFNPQISAERCEQIFELDLELNTQGLEIWLDRKTG